MQALTLTGLESAVTEAIAYANTKGVSVIATAGNSTTPFCNTPAFEPGAVCVASTDRNEVKGGTGGKGCMAGGATTRG